MLSSFCRVSRGSSEPSHTSAVVFSFKEDPPNNSYRKRLDVLSRPMIGSHSFPKQENREAGAGRTGTEGGCNEERTTLLPILVKPERFNKKGGNLRSVPCIGCLFAFKEHLLTGAFENTKVFYIEA